MLIRKANAKDSIIVAEMVAKLLSELSDTTIGKEMFLDISIELLSAEANGFTAFLIYTGTEPPHYTGLLTITEVSALYVGGRFGVIQEFYITPEGRSKGIGHLLLKEAISYGRQYGWKRIEVGAPNLMKWARSVDFYKREGFVETGPRLKLIL